jgi:hypothetical protein
VGCKRHFAAEAGREMRALDEKTMRVRCIIAWTMHPLGLIYILRLKFSELKLRTKILNHFSSLVWSRVAHLCGIEFL